MSQQVRGVISRAQGRAGRGHDDRGARPGAGRGGGHGPGLRGLPHRPALPRGRHQRRLPVPARPRGRRHRRAGRRRASPTWPPATSWCSTGGPSAATCRACRRGPAVVLLRHPQRHPEDDPDRRHRAVARRWASARSPRRPWCTPGSAPRSTRPPGPAAVGLLGCGVMAGLGAAMNTGEGDPRRLGRGDRLRRRRRRGDRRCAPWPARRRSSRSTSTPASSTGPASSAPPTPSTPPSQRRRSRRSGQLTGGIGADVVIDAVGRPET